MIKKLSISALALLLISTIVHAWTHGKVFVPPPSGNLLIDPANGNLLTDPANGNLLVKP